MIKRLLFFIIGFSFLVVSCDLLRTSPYVVEAWTPGEGYHENPASISVSIKLSHESDTIKTEQAFSLTEDNKPLKGIISWEGTKLTFTPSSPLEENRDYVITLGTGAQDSKGLSLEYKFEASFTTRLSGGKTKITGTSPENEGYIPESRGEFRIIFSEPVTINSCLDFISFNPYTYGSWRLTDDNKTACFTPLDPWQAGSRYQLNVEGDFVGIGGTVLGSEYSSVFYAGEDREKPVLLQALAVHQGSQEVIPLSGEFSAWERFTQLELVFSKPVDFGGLRNL